MTNRQIDAVVYLVLGVMWACVVVMILLTATRSCARVRWIGSPVVGCDEEGGRYHSQPTITSHEIGFREDGVVVWRKQNNARKTEGEE